MAVRVAWSREELLVAFRRYCRTPFGKLHQHNPEIIELARLLGRTPSGVGMKAGNLARLGPALRARRAAADQLRRSPSVRSSAAKSRIDITWMPS